MATVLDLKIYLPTEIFFDKDIKKLTFKGKEGYLTILPNHIDYVSSFETNIITFIDTDGKEGFIALNNGTLVKYSNKLRLTAYKAIFGESLEDLKKKIYENAELEDDIEKEINKNLKQLEYFIYNNLIEMK